MRIEAMKLRIKDLADVAEWPTPTLRRRMQDYQTMESALISMGYGDGFHFSLIRWDESVIREILRNRSMN